MSMLRLDSPTLSSSLGDSTACSRKSDSCVLFQDTKKKRHSSATIWFPPPPSDQSELDSSECDVTELPQIDRFSLTSFDDEILPKSTHPLVDLSSFVLVTADQFTMDSGESSDEFLSAVSSVNGIASSRAAKDLSQCNFYLSSSSDSVFENTAVQTQGTTAETSDEDLSALVDLPTSSVTEHQCCEHTMAEANERESVVCVDEQVSCKQVVFRSKSNCDTKLKRKAQYFTPVISDFIDFNLTRTEFRSSFDPLNKDPCKLCTNETNGEEKPFLDDKQAGAHMSRLRLSMYSNQNLCKSMFTLVRHCSEPNLYQEAPEKAQANFSKKLDMMAQAKLEAKREENRSNGADQLSNPIQDKRGDLLDEIDGLKTGPCRKLGSHSKAKTVTVSCSESFPTECISSHHACSLSETPSLLDTMHKQFYAHLYVKDEQGNYSSEFELFKEKQSSTSDKKDSPKKTSPVSFNRHRRLSFLAMLSEHDDMTNTLPTRLKEAMAVTDRSSGLQATAVVTPTTAVMPAVAKMRMFGDAGSAFETRSISVDPTHEPTQGIQANRSPMKSSASAPVLTAGMERRGSQKVSLLDRIVSPNLRDEASKKARKDKAEEHLPIDIKLAAKDHNHLDNKLLSSFYRRLALLNQCAPMKLDLASKKPYSSELDEEQYALSHKWRFDQGQWSRLPSDDMPPNNSTSSYPKNLTVCGGSQDSVLAEQLDSADHSPVLAKRSGSANQSLNISIPQNPDSGTSSITTPLPSSDSSAASDSAAVDSAVGKLQKPARAGSLLKKFGSLRVSQRKKKGSIATKGSPMEIGVPQVIDTSEMSAKTERLGCVDIPPLPSYHSADDLVNNNRRKRKQSQPDEQSVGDDYVVDYLLPEDHVPGTFPLKLCSAIVKKTPKSKGSPNLQATHRTLDNRCHHNVVNSVESNTDVGKDIDSSPKELSSSRWSIYDNVPSSFSSLLNDVSNEVHSANSSPIVNDHVVQNTLPFTSFQTVSTIEDTPLLSTSHESGPAYSPSVAVSSPAADSPSSSSPKPWLVSAPADAEYRDEIEKLNDVLNDLMASVGGDFMSFLSETPTNAQNTTKSSADKPSTPLVSDGAVQQNAPAAQSVGSSSGESEKETSSMDSPVSSPQLPRQVKVSFKNEHSETSAASASDSSHQDTDQQDSDTEEAVWRARERRDSGVGSSLTREGEKKKLRLRWHSFIRSHRPSFSGRDVELNALTAGQSNILQKLCLIKVTSLMEQFSPPHKSGWNLSVPKFMKKVKATPSYAGRVVFGVPLHVTQQRTGQPLPLALQYAMRYLRRHAQESVGLFRRPGAISRIQKLREDIEKGSEKVHEFDGLQAYDVADMFKQYFRELPECLLTSKLSETFLAIQQHVPAERQLEAFQATLILLPNENREVLESLLYFLSDIAQHSEDNHMPASNLAVVFSPSLFNLFHGQQFNSTPTSKSPKGPRKNSPVGVPEQDLVDQKSSFECLTKLITHCKTLFKVPEDLLSKCSIPYMEEGAPAPLSQLAGDNGDYSAYIDTCTQGLIKETTPKFKGWVNSNIPNSHVEVAHKKIDDGIPLQLWRCSIEVPAPPEEVLHRLKSERHLWDEDFIQWQTVKQLTGEAEVFQFQLSSMAPQPPREFLVFRAWKTDLPRGACAFMSTSVDYQCPSLGGIRAVELASRYLIEPCGAGKSRVTHISRVDMKGRAPAWYNKVYGHLASSTLQRLKSSLEKRDVTQRNLQETKV